MSGDSMCEVPRKHTAAPIRVHDYLYDSAYIVSGAKDYARTAFRAAMASAQVGIQPFYKTMFSELRRHPRAQVVYHPNCRLPRHLDRSYSGYMTRLEATLAATPPHLAGRDRYKYHARPRKLVDMKTASPDFQPPPSSPAPPPAPGRPRNRATQSVYRESSAQTIPWQPDGKAADTCEETPEVLHLDRLIWGPGDPYRTGDLPADFHTTEIINKMRHARVWNEVMERGEFPRWMCRASAIIGDVEMKDWIFREAEIDELQDIRLTLLHRLQAKQRREQTTRASRLLSHMWDAKKKEMERKIDHIRHARDRELRKLSALHEGGGRAGQVSRMRAARGHAGAAREAGDPTSDMHAPTARHGYQARRRHAEITYDPGLLSLEDHKQISEPPVWLSTCGQDLARTCSGSHLLRDPAQLCQRETKWSEHFLETLHNDLKKARLGAASTASAGPLRVLKPRKVLAPPRPATPEVEAVGDAQEEWHQAALLLQRVIRGRAVQTLMYEGRTRAAELTEELKTTHGLQKEDRVRIAREEAKAREFNAVRSETEQKEDAISALVDELCGGAVAAALDFLEKELRRLKEERRQHAYILIALREKTMREAAEAGRRQKEEHRRREHDEMFKQVVGVTQQTVDMYLQEIAAEGVALAAEIDATRQAQAEADRVSASLMAHGSMSTAEQHETVAELVQQCLLPAAHREASRRGIVAAQRARAAAARDAIFGLVDEARGGGEYCTQCGCPLDERCRCTACPVVQQPAESVARDDARWRHTRVRPQAPQKTLEERYPPEHDIRCMLNALVDEAVGSARAQRYERQWLERDIRSALTERLEATIDVREITDYAFAVATGAVDRPPRRSDYKHYMTRVIADALDRTEPFEKCPCPSILPSEARRQARRQALERELLLDPACRCAEETETPKAKVMFDTESLPPAGALLPSRLRALEELRRCKCELDGATHFPLAQAFDDSNITVYDKDFEVWTTSDATTDQDQEQDQEQDQDQDQEQDQDQYQDQD